MPQFPLRLPSRNEAALIGLALLVLLFASWLRRGEKIASLEALLAAKPLVESSRKEEKAKDVKRGPSKTTTKTTFDPNTGKKLAVEKVKESGASEEHTASKSEEARKETPICPQPHHAPTRYIGVAAGLDEWKKPRISGGLTFAERLDVGAYYDSRYSAAGAESRYRW
jgi:hypothetical protein